MAAKRKKKRSPLLASKRAFAKAKKNGFQLDEALWKSAQAARRAGASAKRAEQCAYKAHDTFNWRKELA
jgi:hypothetical protein